MDIKDLFTVDFLLKYTTVKSFDELLTGIDLSSATFPDDYVYAISNNQCRNYLDFEEKAYMYQRSKEVK